jgi:hypothetical protein
MGKIVVSLWKIVEHNKRLASFSVFMGSNKREGGQKANISTRFSYNVEKYWKQMERMCCVTVAAYVGAERTFFQL